MKNSVGQCEDLGSPHKTGLVIDMVSTTEPPAVDCVPRL